MSPKKKLKIGINGFGRIGRQAFRLGFEDFDIVGVNGLMSGSEITHLLKYDSVHGTWDKKIEVGDDHFTVDGKKVMWSKTKDPKEIPWKAWEVDVVLECTGAFKNKQDFEAHIKAGAKRVLVSAPANGVDFTVVYGVNHEQYDPKKDFIVSNASCTTNCLAPLVKVLNEKFGIEKGLMTTIHSYTNDQRILDGNHSDLRRARAAAMSMIPTTTGAAKTVGKILPELDGKIDGFSVRVPTPNVSLVDFTFDCKTKVSIEDVNQALIKASETKALKGILNVEHDPLVSIDFNGNKASSTVDLLSTMVIGENLVKVVSWYDNEIGFSQRMLDMLNYMNDKGL
jgi:glyceraldehyde 3-phosphate dehydrogenase